MPHFLRGSVEQLYHKNAIFPLLPNWVVRRFISPKTFAAASLRAVQRTAPHPDVLQAASADGLFAATALCTSNERL